MGGYAITCPTLRGSVAAASVGAQARTPQRLIFVLRLLQRFCYLIACWGSEPHCILVLRQGCGARLRDRSPTSRRSQVSLGKKLYGLT